MKRILFIGAGFLQSFLVKKAKELDYYVIAVDGDANAEGFKFADEYAVISIVNQKECLKFALNKNIDGVVTAATDYGVLTANYIAKKLNLPGVEYSVAEIIKNKYHVRKILTEAKVDNFSSVYEVTNLDDALRLRNEIKYPVMVKPCDGSGSRGAYRVNYREEFDKACRKALSHSGNKKALIEPFIEGVEYGVESFVRDGEVFVLAVLKKWMTPPPFYAELGHAYPSGLSDHVERKVKACVHQAIKVLGINYGAVNMDVIVTDEQEVYIIDIGIRMGGNLIGSHIVPYATGIDYMRIILSACTDSPIEMTPTRDSHHVVTRLLALKPGTVIGLPNIDDIIGKANVQVEHHLYLGKKINLYKNNTDGCGYVVSVGHDAKTVIKEADRVKQSIDESIERN